MAVACAEHRKFSNLMDSIIDWEALETLPKSSRLDTSLLRHPPLPPSLLLYLLSIFTAKSTAVTRNVSLVQTQLQFMRNGCALLINPKALTHLVKPTENCCFILTFNTRTLGTIYLGSFVTLKVLLECRWPMGIFLLKLVYIQVFEKWEHIFLIYYNQNF